MVEEYEYREYPEVNGIKRVITDRLVLTQVDKDEAVKKIGEELGGAAFGGLYFLVDAANYKIYVGETSDIKERIRNHIKNSPVKEFDFDKVIVIWDGRTIETSHFNDTTLRKSLEYECIVSFKGLSKCNPVNTVEKPLVMSRPIA